MVKLNRQGLPMRVGADVCKFYVTKGECGFGRQCMHHHPNIVPKGGPPAPAFTAGGRYAFEQHQQQPQQQQPPWNGGGNGGGHAMYHMPPAYNAPVSDGAYMGGQTMIIIPQQQFQPPW